MNRILPLLLSFMLILSMLAGCDQGENPYAPTGNALHDSTANTVSPPVSKDQQLTLVYYPDRSMNPYTATDFTNRALFPLMYQSLFSIDRNYNVIPILCQKYSVSADMRTYTIYPEPAAFSDGATLTAADVAASLQAAKSGQYYAGRFQHITGITAEADRVIITLDTPMENLPLLLDIPIVKASEVNASNPLGTGPYIFEEAPGGKRLRRTSYWWCRSDLVVTATYIPLAEGKSPNQIRDQFEFSDLGLVCADPGSDTYADYRCDYELWDIENGIFLYLVSNAKSRVFSNTAVRAALTHAINRDYLVETFYRGFARSATLPASPLSPFYDITLAEHYDYDTAVFADAISAAGFENASVTLLLNADDTLRLRAGRAIADMLSSCGLTVTTLEVNSIQFMEHLKAGDYDLYLGQTRLSANMDLTAFFTQNGGLNYGGLTDTTAYAMCLEALANTGNYYNLHKEVMDKGQLCPILFRSYAVYATRGLVTKLSPARDNMFYYSIGKTLADAKVSQS
ncbi:MAG: ABC transporter substrate-binding protein [Ruminococcaceae bacterium]|nr:ABC transporter substrate-binding protein [Oscillospiraceae bacterium]